MAQGLGLQGGYGAGSAVDELRRLVAERFREQQERNQIAQEQARLAQQESQFGRRLTHETTEAEKGRGQEKVILDLTQAFQRGENELGRGLTREQSALQRAHQTSEREGGQLFQTGERIGGQDFTAGQSVLNRAFQTSEREGGQRYRTGERLGSQRHELDLTDITGRQRLDQIKQSGLWDLAAGQLRVGSKPSTGEQKKALTFYNNMSDAVKDMNEVEDKVSATDMYLINNAAFLPDVLKNPALSQAGQTYATALKTYTEARLRKFSGAAVPPNEYKEDRLAISRQVGDTPETIAQKRGIRETTTESIGFESGPAYEEFYGSPFQTRRQGTTDTGGVRFVFNPKTGRVEKR